MPHYVSITTPTSYPLSSSRTIPSTRPQSQYSHPRGDSGYHHRYEDEDDDEYCSERDEPRYSSRSKQYAGLHNTGPYPGGVHPQSTYSSSGSVHNMSYYTYGTSGDAYTTTATSDNTTTSRYSHAGGIPVPGKASEECLPALALAPRITVSEYDLHHHEYAHAHGYSHTPPSPHTHTQIPGGGESKYNYSYNDSPHVHVHTDHYHRPAAPHHPPPRQSPRPHRPDPYHRTPHPHPHPPTRYAPAPGAPITYPTSMQRTPSSPSPSPEPGRYSTSTSTSTSTSPPASPTYSETSQARMQVNSYGRVPRWYEEREAFTRYR